MGVMHSDSNSRIVSPLRRVRRIAAAVLLALVWGACPAQELMRPAELPEIRHLAAALSDPESRDDALLTLLASIRMRVHALASEAVTAEELATVFRDERARLERLTTRFQRLPARSPVLDPSSWFLLQELDQFEQLPMLSVSPLGPVRDDLLDTLFGTTNERVAAALLPEAIARSEKNAAVYWRDLLHAAERDAALRDALDALAEDWYEPWMAAEPPAPSGAAGDGTAVERGAALLQEMAAMTLQAGPPDLLELKRLRYTLHTTLPDLDGAEARDAGYLLILGSALDGLYAGQYLPLTEALLWVASGLLIDAQGDYAATAAAMPPAGEAEPAPTADPATTVSPEAIEAAGAASDPNAAAPAPYVSPLPRALSDLLPALSSAFSPEFSRVDPRINDAMATVFDTVQYFQSGPSDPGRLRILLSATADAVARFVLLVPDMSFYFDQPIRRPAGGAIVNCIGGIAAAEPDAPTQAAVETCLSGLVQAAETVISAAELAGDPDGPFGTEQLQRELLLAPWQRVNYLLGYLEDVVDPACPSPDEPLPNPLEWSNLVATLDWFARRAPYRFRNDANRAFVADLRDQGYRLLAGLARKTDCVSGAGGGLMDPVLRGLMEYRAALNELIASLREAELAFRLERLEPGADVMLRGDADQATAYRPEDLVIGPCEEASVCEMRGTLEASPALVAQFPDSYLLADQLRLGEVEICYDNVQWVDRRSERVREDDPHVANYHGRLRFDLIGRYRQGEEAQDVFGYTFVSPDEYHYLFGAATPEVLDDSCPTEWVGTRITTPLGGDRRLRVVPDRLTYLTAARSLPSQVITSNWSAGQQWRAAFETDTGVQRRSRDDDTALVEDLGRQLQTLYREEQSLLYNALFTPPERSWRRREETLYDRMAELDTRKALIVAYVNLLYPASMLDSETIRGLLVGRGALLDERMLRQFRREGVAVSEISLTGTARLERMLGAWNRVPDNVRRSGSAAIGVAHALTRLDALERDVFERLLPGEYAPLSFDDLDG